MRRTREIARPAPAGTRGCHGALQEVRQCKSEPCGTAVDCQWAEWESWSECVPAPDMCGVGYKRRVRSIETIPSGGGQLCAPRTKEEVSPVVNCKGQPQCCINGEWATWGDWGTCSATCGRGTRKRSRGLRVRETWCGAPAPGSEVEYGGCVADACSSDRDCAFSEWSKPSPCSAGCHGHRLRTRHVLVNGAGQGKPCEGATEIAERCNPAAGQPEPFSCELDGQAPTGPRDCKITEWSDWSGCTATCERGYQTRFRHIQVHAAKGGRPCPTSTRELVSCHTGVSCFQDRVDCAWSPWTAWSECDSLGDKVRTRGISVPPKGGGLACQGPVKEVATCREPEGSCEITEHTCYWGWWSDWSDCSATCGSGGVRARTRQLQVSNATPAVLKIEAAFDLPAMELRLQDAESQRNRELSMAFLLGCACLTALLAASWTAAAVRSSLCCRWESRALEYNAVPQHA